MKITFNLATTPERLNGAVDTISSIYNQADEIRIYLNRFSEVPEIFKGSKIITHIGEDLRSSGKLYWSLNKDEYYFCIDDDLIYPKSYAKDMIKKLNQYNDEIILSLHGKRLKPGVKSSYFRGIDLNLRCLKEVKKDYWVHVIGNGVSVFNTNKIIIDYKTFKYNYMDDISVSLELQNQQRGALVMAHNRDYLRYNPPPVKTLYDEFINNDSTHTEIVNSINWTLFLQ